MLRNCCLPVLSSASIHVTSEVVSLLLVESVTTILPYAQREWWVVSMLLGAAQYDALAHLHHWLQAVQVQPSESPARIQQSFPTLFLVYTQLGFFSYTSCVLHGCARSASSLATLVDLSACWSLLSSWSVDALISPNKCITIHYTRSADEGGMSLGAHVCSGIPLAIECSKEVSTSSSVDGPGMILSLRNQGKRFRTLVMSIHSFISSMHCWGFWRNRSIDCSHVDVALYLGVDFGSFWTFGISFSFVVSTSCIVLSWAPLTLVSENMC